jgi:hypothetical protein
MKHGIVLAIIWGRRYVGQRQEINGQGETPDLIWPSLPMSRTRGICDLNNCLCQGQIRAQAVRVKSARKTQ